MSTVNLILIIYLLTVNIIAFLMYGIDKSRARRGKWRISEQMLIGIAVIGGSIGALLGMLLFHHKTRHWYFRFGIPAILLIQGVLIWLIFFRKNI